MAHSKMRVLVTDGEQRSALAAVRSLGRAGHLIAVCAGRRGSLAGASRYCRTRTVVPDPLGQPDTYVDALLRLVTTERIEALLPMTDASLSAVLPRRAEFGDVLIPFPSHDQYQRISDKALVLERAKALGIAVPRQHVLCSAEHLERLDPAEIAFPLVIKPARSVVDSGGRRLKTSVVHVADARSLPAAVRALNPGAFPALLQERIVGDGVGVFLLVWNGEVVSAFAHRRLREKPPSGGVSVLRESWPLDPGLYDRSRALLQEFAWQGAAMVEYKLDRRTKVPYLMEINGRLWGSLQLAVDAGCDFPATLLDVARGARPPSPHSYRPGVQTRWLLGDVDHLLLRLRRSPAELGLTSDAAGRGRAVLEFLAGFAPGIRNEVFRWSDAMPAFTEAASWLRGR